MTHSAKLVVAKLSTGLSGGRGLWVAGSAGGAVEGAAEPAGEVRRGDAGGRPGSAPHPVAPRPHPRPGGAGEHPCHPPLAGMHPYQPVRARAGYP